MFTFWGFSLFATVFTYGLLFDCRMMYVWLFYFVSYLTLGYLQGHYDLNRNRTKIRIGTWNPATDPNVYFKFEINLTKVDKFIQAKAKEGVKVTYTHFALKALGNSFVNNREELAKIVFGRVVPMEDVDVFTLVDIDNGRDLTGMTVKKCDKLSIRELKQQMEGKVSKIKNKTDGDHKKQTQSAE